MLAQVDPDAGRRRADWSAGSGGARGGTVDRLSAFHQRQAVAWFAEMVYSDEVNVSFAFLEK